MDLAAVFALSILGGYFFAYFWRLTRYEILRLEGHHRYFRVAVFGGLFFVLALTVRHLLISRCAWFELWDSSLLEYVRPSLKEEAGIAPAVESRRTEWVVASLYSLLLGPFTGLLLNLLTPKQWAQRRTVGTLDQVLLRAQQDQMPVNLSLNNGKIYIGLVVSITKPSDDPALLTLLPMFSGYRDQMNRMVLTNDYRDVYTKLSDPAFHQQLGLPPPHWSEQFHIAIRADAVISVNLFSPSVYAEFNPDWRERIAQQKQKPAPLEVTIRIKPPL